LPSDLLKPIFYGYGRVSYCKFAARSRGTEDFGTVF
jgi:hypothetical protein